MTNVKRLGVAHAVCLMVHRRVFDGIGPPVDDPRLGGYEDDEFFRRARRAGFHMGITGRSFIHHFGSVTQRSIKAASKGAIKSLGDREYYRRKYGLTVVGQLQRIPREELTARFGSEGERLYCLAHGIDIGAEVQNSEPLRAETVLERDTGDVTLLRQYLHRTVDRFCHLARSGRLVVQSLRLSIRYTDGKRAQKTIAFPRETAGYVAVSRGVEAAFDALCSRRVGVRSIAMDGRRPGQGSGQTDLFDNDQDDRQERLGESIARVRKASGFDAVFIGGDYGAYVKEMHHE